MHVPTTVARTCRLRLDFSLISLIFSLIFDLNRYQLVYWRMYFIIASIQRAFIKYYALISRLISIKTAFTYNHVWVQYLVTAKWTFSWKGPVQQSITRACLRCVWWTGTIEIIDIECGLLSRVSPKIVKKIATKWRIYTGTTGTQASADVLTC